MQLEILLILRYPLIVRSYQEDLEPYLIIISNQNAKRVRIESISKADDHNIRYFSNCTITTLSGLALKAIKEYIRTTNVIEEENTYTRKKSRDNFNLINKDVRNCFAIGSIIPSILKCCYDFNYYTMKDKIINYSLINEEYPYYSR